jgi:adenylate cyclase class 2
MYEIERKFRLSGAEAEQVRTKLEAKYGPGKKLTQKDEHFLFKKTFYGEHVAGEPIVRLRSSDSKHYFTYKHTVLQSGNRVEHETEVSNPSAMREALIAMGWNSVIHIKKTRLHYHAGGVTYDLDNVQGLGDFLEIEIVSEKDADAEPMLISVAKSLGIPANRIERRNYGALLQEKTDA